MLLVTDGVATAGSTTALELRATVRSMAPGTRRLDVLSRGEHRDGTLLRELVQDLQIIAAAWLARGAGRFSQIRAELARQGIKPATRPSLRFVLSWETDANDVDLHVTDRWGAHASYNNRQITSGGELYEDVTDGYGPECFVIHGRPVGYPYRLGVHYYSRGPMGYGMGTVQGISHDGRGHLRFVHRPFVVMENGAHLELGQVNRL